MVDQYAEYCINNDDDLEGDEEIGALGSILSWDEELDDDDGTNTGNLTFQVPMPTPVGYTVVGMQQAQDNQQQTTIQPQHSDVGQVALPQQVFQQQQPQQPQNHQIAQHQQLQQNQTSSLQHQTVYVQTPQGIQAQQQAIPQSIQMINTAPNSATTAPGASKMQNFTLYQQPGQQLYTTINAQPGQSVALQQGIQGTLATLPHLQGTEGYSVPSPVFLQPMPNSQVAIAPSGAAVQQPSPVTTSASLHKSATPATQTKKRVTKRKSNAISAQTTQIASAAGVKNIVSCSSDTEGEASTKTATGVSIGAPKSDKAVKEVPSTENMTPDERAKANRDRNREHARNTRLRKKAYLEKLKSTVDELCRERDTLVSERAGAANLLVEMHNTRTEVLLSFFALRSSYERRRELWASILDESCFACVMPVTPYRSFPASEVQVSKCQRTVMGIDGIMADTASLHVLLNTLIDRAQFPQASVQFRYTLVTEDAVVAGQQMMARWVMSTVNATQCGAKREVTKRGMLCCKFNSAHKIVGLELMFDVMAFMLQLKQATGRDSFVVVPNTVQTCQRPFDTAMVMTVAERPYTIVQVNSLWEEMTGYKAEDVVGKASCQVLQGQETERSNLGGLMEAVRFKRPAFTTLLNYTREGQKFRHFLNVYPLSTDSKITHFLGLTVHVDWSEKAQVHQQQQQQQAQVQVQAQVPAPTQQLIVASGVPRAAPVGIMPTVVGSSTLPSTLIASSTNGVALMPPQQILSAQNTTEPNVLQRS